VRVLAFEDGADIALLLANGGVEFSTLTIEQRWRTEDAIGIIKEFAPDILLLDHYIPPTKGLDVLRELNQAVSEGELTRPSTIVGMSSLQSANEKMLLEGADIGIVKPQIASLPIWPKRQS
jgi:response regulator of citrate/malate metabolism